LKEGANGGGGMHVEVASNPQKHCLAYGKSDCKLVVYQYQLAQLILGDTSSYKKATYYDGNIEH
jgi:hypothetical protein